MLPRELGDLARYLNVSSHGSVPISGFTIDSRKAVAGDLFVALVADRDGHDYIKVPRRMERLPHSCQNPLT